MAMPKRIVAELVSTVRAALSAEALRRSTEDLEKLSTPERKALASAILQGEFKKIDQSQVSRNRARLTDAEQDALKVEVMAEAVGLGLVDLLLADPTVEEVCFTRYDLGFTYHSDGSVREVPDDYTYASDAALKEWVSYAAATKGGTGRAFNSQQPILVLQLGDGLRLAATCEVSKHTSFSLRRNTLGEVSLADLVGLGMFPEAVAELFRALIRAPEIRIVIVGATGAGKTTLVRAMLNETERLARICIVEDTREIGLFDDTKHPNCEEFESRDANLQGEGRVSLDALVAQFLRYRPDMLILGEVRSSDAAVPMVYAMSNGLASLTTTHEHTARGGLEKLAEMLAEGTESTRGMELGLAKVRVSRSVDIAIHVDRGLNGQRFVSEIVEVAGHQADQIQTQQIYAADWTGKQKVMNRISTQLVSDKLRRAGYKAEKPGAA